MLSTFIASLATGWPSALAAVAGFTAGRRLMFPKMGVIGLALLLLSLGLIIGSLFLVPGIIGDCRTDRGHALLSIHSYAAIALSSIGALGAGLLAARIWAMHQVGGTLLALAIVLAAMPYGFFTVFAVTFRPDCYL